MNHYDNYGFLGANGFPVSGDSYVVKESQPLAGSYGAENSYDAIGNRQTSIGSSICTYDFIARQYAPSTGRFTTIDPLAEKYYSISPYAYCAGNPVNLVDPDGSDVWIVSEDGFVLWRYKDKTKDAFVKFVRGEDEDVRTEYISF